jgi:hypothetical protein
MCGVFRSDECIGLLAFFRSGSDINLVDMNLVDFKLWFDVQPNLIGSECVLECAECLWGLFDSNLSRIFVDMNL